MPGAGPDNPKVQNLLTGSRHSFYLTQAVEADRQQPGIITWGTPNAHPRTFTPRDVDHGIALANQVASYPTPKGSPSGPDFAMANRPGSGGDDLATAIARGQSTPQTWGTPTSRGGKRKGELLLTGQVKSYATPQTWASPTCRDSMTHSDLSELEENAHLSRQAIKRNGETSGSLSPLWVEWLQGFPPEWTDCAASVTPRCLSAWRRRSRCWLRLLGYEVAE